MHRASSTLSCFLTVLILMSGTDTFGQVSASPGGHVRPVASPIPDAYIVVLKDSDGSAEPVDVDAEAEFVAARFGATIGARWKHALHGFAAHMSRASAEALASDPGIAWVEEDGTSSLNTAEANAPWGLDRIDQRDLPLNQTYNYYAGGSGVTAYVLDSGIRATHTDFGGRVAGGVTYINDGHGTDDWCLGHGTFVAGVIGGTTYGVAKSVNLVPVRVADCNGGLTTANIINGVDWVITNHTASAVANLSFGGPTSDSEDAAVTNLINAGVTTIIAAGNNNQDACNYSPSRVATAIKAAATTSADARASYSNYGQCISLFAPGDNITSDWNTSDTATHTDSGTSFSAPHVTGAAALYLSTDPTALPARVARALATSTSANKVSSPGYGSPNMLLFSAGVGLSCNPGYTSCGGACRSNSYSGPCGWTDCECGATAASYCNPGPAQCFAAALGGNSFLLQRTVSFTGNDGPWTALTESPTFTINLQNLRDVDVGFSCWFNSSSPSVMGLDVHVLIDGVEAGVENDTVNLYITTCHAIARNVAPGTHSVSLGVRSRLLNGPPGPVQLWAAYYSSGPTSANATVLRVP